jgi:hypothetical protein
MRLLKTIVLSLVAFAQVALCAEDYYKVRPGSRFSILAPDEIL